MPGAGPYGIVSRMTSVEECLADLAHGARWLRRRKRFAILSTLIIAIGIGGATAIFSVADAVVLRPLPYAHADRLFVIFEYDRSRGIRGPTSYPAFVDWRNGSHSFDAFAATTAERLEVTLTGSGDPEVIAAAAVSGDFFQLLGVPPLVGRSLLPDDDRPGSAVAVLSYALWRERFAADPGVVGRTMVLQGRPHTIVGVMPSQFAFPTGAHVWLPMRAEEPLLLAAIADGLFHDVGAGVGWLTVVGRLRDGASIEAARGELSGIWRRMYRRSMADIDTSTVDPGVIDSFIENHAAAPVGIADVILGAVRPNVLAVLVGGLLVLAIASTNMAGLLLALAIERKRDFSIREALGASRARLIRAALTETLLLAMIGTAAGLLLAWWATPILSSLMPSEIPRADQIALNMRVIGFAGLAMSLVAVVAAVSPMALVRRGALEELIRRASSRMVEDRKSVV